MTVCVERLAGRVVCVCQEIGRDLVNKIEASVICVSLMAVLLYWLVAILNFHV